MINKLKFIMILFLQLSLVVETYSQNVINPYQNIIGTSIPISDWDAYLQSWSNTYNPFPSIGHAPPFSGEYQILLDNNFPWMQFINNGSITVTYQMEVVSFPFTVPCATTASGCSYNPVNPPIQRDLFLPTDPYDPNNRQWGQISNMLPDFLPLDWSNVGSNRQTLISDAFVNNHPYISTTNAKLLPHTIIKHTINAYCSGTLSPFSTLLSTVSWYYDNTRGRMRNYPFCTSNCTNSSAAWDICFLPSIITDHNNFNPYSYNLNNQLFVDGIINYFLYSEIPNPSNCTNVGTALPAPIDNFRSTQSTFNFIYPPPYSLLSAPALNSTGTGLAGYETSFNATTNSLNGYQQHYYIDTDFELTDINPIDRVIFNPSDVTITASDLHFPSGYTFKTIRGVYPSVAEVTRDDTPENGGPFIDPRQVPVITDLRCEDPLFPHDPAVLDDAKYSSLYRLASGSKLTIDPCVTVYDAAFILNAGSTLDFSNYNSFRGMPRIAIDRNGGRLIRRFVPNNATQTLYLQNETRPVNEPNGYFIEGKIEAGKNVDATQPPGNYIVDANAGLELVASEYIAFKEGFSSKANSNLVARIDNTISIPQCRIANSGSGNRMSLNSNSSQQQNLSTQEKNKCDILIYPSIFNSNITIDFPTSTGIKKLVIFDALGKIVYHLSSEDFSAPIELSQLNEGIYFVKIDSESCNSFSKTIVKNERK